MSLFKLGRSMGVPMDLMKKLEKGGKLGRYLEKLEMERRTMYDEYMEEEMAIRRELEKPMNKGGLSKKKTKKLKMNKGGAVHTDYRSKGLFR
tara:strand:+ start:151 stop:426 length:276 start_codon:yes stop_codon:yes gene_type:complete